MVQAVVHPLAIAVASIILVLALIYFSLLKMLSQYSDSRSDSIKTLNNLEYQQLKNEVDEILDEELE